MDVWIDLLTGVHTILSLGALLWGVAIVWKLALGQFLRTKDRAYLFASAATTLTGFLFPSRGLTPALVVGILSGVTLLLTLVARSKASSWRQGWRRVYVAGVILNEYLLFFVAVAQAFTKIPVLHDLAPTLKELPFGIAQGAVLIAFVVLTVFAIRRSASGKVFIVGQSR